MFVGIHSLKPQVTISGPGVSPIILSATIDYSDMFYEIANIVVSGSQPINWYDSSIANGGTITNTPYTLYISNPSYGRYNHCVTFTNSYGTTGTSVTLSSSDPSP